MKPADVKKNTHINFARKSNNKDHKFQVGDHVRISKYKNIFSKEVFVIKKKSIILFHGHMLLVM